MISEADDSRQIRTWPLVASRGVSLPHAVEVGGYAIHKFRFIMLQSVVPFPYLGRYFCMHISQHTNSLLSHPSSYHTDLDD